MASSTALTTICGSMPFSRLRASIFSYSGLAMIALLASYECVLLKFRYQTRAFYVAQRDFQCRARAIFRLLRLVLFPFAACLDLQPNQVALTGQQTSFKMAIAGDGLARHQLRFASCETLKICRPRQLPIEPGR